MSNNSRVRNPESRRITASFKFSDEFLVEALKRNRIQRRSKVFLLTVKFIAAGLLIALGGFVALQRDQIGLGLFMVGLCFLMCFSHHIDFWLARRSFRKSPYRDETVKIEFSEAGFHATSSKQDVKLQWACFTQVAHFRDGFLLFHGPKMFNWIPFSSLGGPVEVEELQRLLHAKIQTHTIVQKGSISA